MSARDLSATQGLQARLGICPAARNGLAALVLIFPCLLLGSCTGRTEARSPTPALDLASRIETEALADRPRLALVEYQTEGAPAITLAVSSSLDAEVNWVLAELLRRRLTHAHRAVQASAHGAGYLITAAHLSPADVPQFIEDVQRALVTPLGSREPIAAFRELLGRLRLPRAARGDPVDDCVAAAVAQNPPPLSDDDAKARQQIERWRSSQSFSLAALGVVASAPLLDRARTAWRGLESGATLAPRPPDFDPWPTRDSISTTSLVGPGAQLTIAVRTENTSAALVAAREMGANETPLASLLAAMSPALQLDQVTAVVRPRGACLRLDLTSEGRLLGPAALARVVSLLRAELGRALARTPENDWPLRAAVLEADDAAQASQIGAWQALSGILPSGPDRFAVRYSGADLGPVTAGSVFRAPTIAPIEVVSRAEAGRRKLAFLVGSPCATARETSAEGGALALTLSTLARQVTGEPDLRITPWLTTEAAGLLLEVRWQGPGETTEEQARRGARALALALTGRLSGASIHEARQSLLDRFLTPAPDLWLALETLAPNHLTALEPRGSFTSVSTLVAGDLEATRERFLRGPLRVAVLGPTGTAEARAFRDQLGILLAPFRTEAARCAALPALPPPGSGLFRIETAHAPRASALVATPIVGRTARLDEADFTEWLLNRPGGWLDKRLGGGDAIASARATVYGGKRARALVIELHASKETNVDTAIEQARQLLVDLAAGVANQRELDQALEHFRALHAGPPTLLSRLGALWEPPPPSSLPSLASLRRFHGQAFRSGGQVVVIAEQKN